MLLLYVRTSRKNLMSRSFYCPDDIFELPRDWLPLLGPAFDIQHV
jgi:hypothetical protein